MDQIGSAHSCDWAKSALTGGGLYHDRLQKRPRRTGVTSDWGGDCCCDSWRADAVGFRLRDRMLRRRTSSLPNQCLVLDGAITCQGAPVKEFLKTTVIGGALFPLPVALILFVLSHAMRLANKVRQSAHRTTGRFCRRHCRHRPLHPVISLDLVYIGHYSPYRCRQTHFRLVGALVSRSLAAISAHEKHGRRPSAHRKCQRYETGDGQYRGQLLEQLENDWVAVFLPQAPSPMSGKVMYFPVAGCDRYPSPRFRQPRS